MNLKQIAAEQLRRGKSELESRLSALQSGRIQVAYSHQIIGRIKDQLMELGKVLQRTKATLDPPLNGGPQGASRIAR